MSRRDISSIFKYRALFLYQLCCKRYTCTYTVCTLQCIGEFYETICIKHTSISLSSKQSKNKKNLVLVSFRKSYDQSCKRA